MLSHKNNPGYYRNSGHCNTGDYNSGHCNTGDYNSGRYNSGNRNSGHYNTGRCNSGNRNSGDYNSGDDNSGFFNTNKPSIRLFNKETGKKRSEITIPVIYLPLTTWVPSSDMSKEDKKRYPEYKTTGGYLLKLSYKEAWSKAWAVASDGLRQQFLDLPNFCPKIFEEITGIDVTKHEIEVVANGKKVFISKDSAIALGLLGED